MQFFYSNLIEGNEIIFDRIEADHMKRSLRKSVGTVINVLDGKGHLYHGILTEMDRQGAKAQVQTKEALDQLTYHLHIAISPTKNNSRLEWFLEKAVEIGVSEISLIVTGRSERRTVNIERCQRILVSALKQSGAAFLPALHLVDLIEVIKSSSDDASRYIAHCGTEGLPLLSTLLKPREAILVLIGPEGDFSREEIELAKQNKFVEISLGNKRLRTETAGVFVSAMINVINQRI